MSKEIVVKEIHKQARKNFPRRHVVMKDIDDLWQADLIDMQSISRENSNFKYILAVIDVFSKYAWVYPLKQKNMEQTFKAFQHLFSKNRIPKNLQTDLGTEFYNKKLKTLFNHYNINHYSTYSTKKASVVERFIRTFKGIMYRYFSLKGNYVWFSHDILSKLIEMYNGRMHRTIGLKPNQVNASHKEQILQKYKNNIRLDKRFIQNKTILKFGDYVRISKYKGTFEKGYTPNWSTEIFKIIKIQNTDPVTYLLEDAKKNPILGSFYIQELQKTRHPDIYLVEKVIKKNGNKLFVKWLGLPSNENCWIDKSKVL